MHRFSQQNILSATTGEALSQVLEIAVNKTEFLTSIQRVGETGNKQKNREINIKHQVVISAAKKNEPE